MRPLTLLALGTLAIVVGVTLLASLAQASHVSGHSAFQGCAKVTHTGAAGSRSYKVSLEASPVASAACSNQAGYKIAAGSCWTLNADLTTTGAPPATPDTIEVYILPDFAWVNHGTDGNSQFATYWAKYTYTGATFDGAAITHCATTTGVAGATSVPGTFRIVIRACEYTSGSSCPGSATAYDFHNDPDTDGGSPGTGNTVSNQAQGGLVAGMAPSLFSDNILSTDTDQTTYVGGDTRCLRVRGLSAASIYYETILAMSIISQDGASTLDTGSANISATTDADKCFTTGMPVGSVYAENTQPTKRVAVTQTSTHLGEAWTYFTSAPSGATLTSATQIDAPWGLVVRGLDIGDPLWISGESVNVSETANLTIGLSYDNGTARTGAASNISLHIRAPDGTWTSDAHPTELTFPGGTVHGFYYYTFTASQEGTYKVFATQTTTMNEKRHANPYELRAGPKVATRDHQTYADTQRNLTASDASIHSQTAYLAGLANSTTAPLATTTHLANTNNYHAALQNSTTSSILSELGSVETALTAHMDALSASDALLLFAVRDYLAGEHNETQLLALAIQNYLAQDDNATYDALDDTLQEILANIQDANNTASGALSFSTFYQWQTGEWRPMWNTTNGTARETTVTREANDTQSAIGEAYTHLNLSIDSLHVVKHGTTWVAEHVPSEPDRFIAFLGALGLGLYSVVGWGSGADKKKKTASFVAAAILAFVTFAPW